MDSVPRIAVAVFIGLVITAALSIGTDLLFVAAGVYPKDGDLMSNQRLLLLAWSYRAIFSILGAFVAALVAKDHFKRAVVTLGLIATLLGVMGIFVMWNKWDRTTGWYPISLALLALPYCLIGGELYKRSQSTKS